VTELGLDHRGERLAGAIGVHGSKTYPVRAASVVQELCELSFTLHEQTSG
jgi:hypothetical protein